MSINNLDVVRLYSSSSTALGPALVISIFMASKVVGSKVVLCTDGCANVGVGGMVSKDSEFYERLGETARSKGSVWFFLFSVMSFDAASGSRFCVLIVISLKTFYFS